MSSAVWAMVSQFLLPSSSKNPTKVCDQNILGTSNKLLEMAKVPFGQKTVVQSPRAGISLVPQSSQVLELDTLTFPALQCTENVTIEQCQYHPGLKLNDTLFKNALSCRNASSGRTIDIKNMVFKQQPNITNISTDSETNGTYCVWDFEGRSEYFCAKTWQNVKRTCFHFAQQIFNLVCARYVLTIYSPTFDPMWIWDSKWSGLVWVTLESS